MVPHHHVYTHLVCWAVKESFSRGSQGSRGDLFPTPTLFLSHVRETLCCPTIVHCIVIAIFFSLFLKCLRLGFKSIILVFLSLTALYPIIMLQQQLQKYSLDNWGQCLFSAGRLCFPRCSYTLLLWQVIQRHNETQHFYENSKVVDV